MVICTPHIISLNTIMKHIVSVNKTGHGKFTQTACVKKHFLNIVSTLHTTTLSSIS